MLSKAILCIDDEKIVLDSLRSQLREAFGSTYALEFVEDAEEGLEVIEELVGDGVQILIIVSDWLMPGMNGDEFLVKVHEKYPLIVKVMLTGQANPDAIKNAIDNANLFKVILKPWDRIDLINTIRDGIKLNE